MRLFTYIGSCVLLLYAALSAVAQKSPYILDPRKQLSQFVFDNKNTDHGLPTNNLNAITQDYNNFIWISSNSGLIRYDGVKFDIFDRKTTPEFKNNMLTELLVTSDSTLWIGTRNSGLIAYKDGIFKNYGSESGIKSPVLSLFADKQNHLYIGTQDAGAYIFDKKQFNPLAQGSSFSSASVSSIEQDSMGAIWFGTHGQGLYNYINGRLVAYMSNDETLGQQIEILFVDKNGTLWVGSDYGLDYFDFNEQQFSSIQHFRGKTVSRITQDDIGNLWVAATGQLVRINRTADRIDVFSQQQGFVHLAITDLLIDTEGSLWMTGTTFGLSNIKDSRFISYMQTEGLRDKVINTVFELSDNTILAGSENGNIDMIKNGNVSPFKINLPANNVRISHITADEQRNLWISTQSGLIKLQPDGVQTWFSVNNGFPAEKLTLCYPSRFGEIWVGTQNNGLIRIDNNGEYTIYDIHNGLYSNFVSDIKEDSNGNFWVATNGGGLCMFEGDKINKHYHQGNGLISDIVFGLYIDNDDVVWAATNLGISRIDETKITNIGIENGLPDEAPFDIIQDANNDFWLPASKGIIYIKNTEIQSFVNGETNKIATRLFTKKDGMKQLEFISNTKIVKAADGGLWFPSINGVVVIYPDDIKRNNVAPQIHITGMQINEKFVDINSRIVLPPGNGNITIHYTAPSFYESSKVQFMYRLEPVNETWVEAGSRRTAYFTNLSHGNYTFVVTACNSDGVWNTVPARLSFAIKPTVFQTIWFKIFVVLFVILIGAFVYKIRILRLQRRQIELENTVRQRTLEISEINVELEQKQEEVLAQSEQIYVQNIEMASQNAALEKAYQELDTKNKDLNSSLLYAKTIQEAIMTDIEHIRAALPQSFILFRPRDIVSGDFYWFLHIQKEGIDKIIIAAIDCTGHGVPGAFMSMIGDALLNQITQIQNITEPDQILNELRTEIRLSLKQDQTGNKDGMDVALCVIDNLHKKVLFAGARNSLVCIKNGELQRIEGDRHPIGGKRDDMQHAFTKHIIDIDQPTILYLTSDGYADQFGGVSGKKFMRRRLFNLFLDIHHLPMDEQRAKLEESLLDWMGNEIQNDDILVIGVKLE